VLRNLVQLSASALLLAGWCSCREAGGKDPQFKAGADAPNVVLISIDMLRPDHLNCYGYPRDTSPAIDQLADEGVLFENVISSASWTLPAHCAMLTGLTDSVHGCMNTENKLDPSRITLAERLRDAGYSTFGFFSGPYLHPVFGLDQGFDEYVDCTSYPTVSRDAALAAGRVESDAINRRSHEDITSPRVLHAVLRRLNDQTRRPFFFFIHLWDVHFDFLPPPPYDRMFDPDYEGPITGRDFFYDWNINAKMKRRDLEHLLALYDGEIRWTDEHVRQILERIDELGLRENTIVVLTADHGTEFFEHGDKGHRKTLFDEVIRVPLIVRYPARFPAGRRFADQTRIIDILPTITDLVGMGTPSNVMGQSLVPLVEGGRLEQDNLALSRLNSVGRRLTSFRRPERKTIHEKLRDGYLIYDLTSDPDEKHPLRDANDPVIAAAREDVRAGRAWRDAYLKCWPPPKTTSALTPELRRKLESLGYLEPTGEDTP